MYPDIDAKQEEEMVMDFVSRKGEVLINRAVLYNPKNIQFFAALFSDFTPYAIRDEGKGRLVLTGHSRAFRKLRQKEKVPRYHLSVATSSANAGAWVCTFTELPPKPRLGFFKRWFGRKKEHKELVKK